MPFPNYIGRTKYWTQDKTVKGLKLAASEIKGRLPCSDSAYNAYKKGRLDLPVAANVLLYFGSMARGWLAAGVSINRISLTNIDWSQRENDYILDNAGTMRIMDIGKNLGRTYGAVRKQLQILGTRARDAEGYLSAAQLSKEFNCSCHRLRTLLNDGAIKGAVYDKTRNRWKIDPIFINAETEAKLRAPRRTHKTHPLDVGDYYQRYGIVRHKALELPYLEPEKRN